MNKKINKDEVLKRLDKVKFLQSLIPSIKTNGKPEALGLCPFHHDTNPSLSINIEKEVYFCHACGARGDFFTLYQKVRGVDFKTALREIEAEAGINEQKRDSKPRNIDTFKYTDVRGNPIYVKTRVEPGRNGRSKEFIFRHTKDNAWKLGRDCNPVLYHLHGIVTADIIFIVEGEKKADLLISWGLVATTLDSGAASKWRNEYNQYFKNKIVIILPDKDRPGHDYALKIANTLHGEASEIKIIDLPELSDSSGEDILDWIMKDSKNDKHKLLSLVDKTAKWEPEQSEVLTYKRRYDEKGKPIFEPLIEVEIFKQNKHLIFLNEQIHMYQNGWYQHFDDRYFLKLIEEQIKTFLNGRRGAAKEILETLKDNLHQKYQAVNTNPNIINVRNGLLDVNTMKLIPHSPNYICTYQVNANYDPYATCPTFEKFLSEILIDEETLEPDEELTLLLQQFMGYCLYPATPFHESLIFYGGGRNGKGITVFVISFLFNGLTSKVHFEDIGVDRFATADLAEKLVNISSEFSADARLNDGQIKSIIAGDELRAQRKHQQPFDFRPFAKHIISTNNLPRSRDKSLGFFSRFMIIPFNRTFLKQEDIDVLPDDEAKRTYSVRDPFLEEKLKKEMDGIFLWSVNGLKDLLDNNGFCNSRQVQKYRNIFKIRSSSVEAFSEDKLKDDCTKDIELQALYRAYLAYCRDYQIPPDSNKRFASTLRNLGYEIRSGTNNTRIVKGVSF